MDKSDLISADGKIHMYTVQTKAVADCIERLGYSVVKKEYIEKKYGESSWVFDEAYGFFRCASESMGFFPSEGAESPIWLFASKKWLYGELGSFLIEAAFSPERLLIFDREKWQKVLSLSYIGRDEEDEKRFSKSLDRAGIQSGFEVFSTPFYPLFKAEIKRSRERIFDTENTSPENIQAAVWKLKKDDIVSLKSIR